jgi:hypothetical protein
MSAAPNNTPIPSTNHAPTHSAPTHSAPTHSAKPSSTHGSGAPLYDLMEGAFFYPIILLVLTLIVILGILLSGTNPNNSVEEIGKDNSSNKIAGDIMIILFICLLIFILCVTLIPNFKNLKELFIQISSVTYVIIYTIFVVLLFSMVPNSILDKFAYLIVPTTMILGAFAFYKATAVNYLAKIDLNYERIKSMVLLFCLITIIIVYYNIDPGGLMNKYFGYSLLLTIVLTVFAFMYLIIVLTLGHKDIKPNDKSTLLQKFSKFGAYGSVLFFMFIIGITLIIIGYPGGFFSEDNKARAGGSIIVILLICSLVGMLLISNLFPELSDKNVTINKLDIFKRSLLMLFGTVVSIMIIVWLVYNLQNLSGQSSILSFIINSLLMLAILTLIFRIIVAKTPAGNSAKSNALNDLIMNTIFYIPCLFSGGFDIIMKTSNKQYSPKEQGDWYMLLLAVSLFVVYFSIPFIYNRISQQGGKLLINKPVQTDTESSLGSYEFFSDGTYDYNYAISFWLFLGAFPPSTSPAYNKYSSILSYGGKPKVSYNSSENTLLITMKYDAKIRYPAKLHEVDEIGDRILYKGSNMLLQKWHNIIINYNGGVMDIFLNGELVKSNNGVVPYYTLDKLTVGEKDGYIGGVCNLVYHKNTLTANNIYFIYNTLKTANPPTTNESNKTIIKDKD